MSRCWPICPRCTRAIVKLNRTCESSQGSSRQRVRNKRSARAVRSHARAPVETGWSLSFSACHLPQEGQFAEDFAGTLGHRAQRILSHMHGETGLLLQELIQAAEQRATAGEHPHAAAHADADACADADPDAGTNARTDRSSGRRLMRRSSRARRKSISSPTSLTMN